MSTIQASVLGIIQGVTEFFPVSSTAHLSIISNILGFEYQGRTFDVFLNFGTLLAIMAFFHKDVAQLFVGAVDVVRRKKSYERNYFITIVLASLPTITLGGIAEVIFDINPNSTLITGINLILFGIILYLCDNGIEQRTDVSRLHAFFIGCAQALAIIPGVSRLGSCLSVARYLKYSRWQAFHFSMVLSLPVVAGACFLKMLKVFEGKVIIHDWNFILVGTIFSFVFGLITLKGMQLFLKKYTFQIFTIYRIILGVLMIFGFCS